MSRVRFQFDSFTLKISVENFHANDFPTNFFMHTILVRFSSCVRFSYDYFHSFFLRTIFSRVRFQDDKVTCKIFVLFCHEYDFRNIFFMPTISVRFLSLVRFPYDFVHAYDFSTIFVTCSISVPVFHAYDFLSIFFMLPFQEN